MCQNTKESSTENTTSKIWLSGPICAPYRLIAALVLTSKTSLMFKAKKKHFKNLAEKFVSPFYNVKFFSS